MRLEDIPTIDAQTQPEPALRVRVRPKAVPAAKTKEQPPYCVVLHNDDINRFEWVVGVLMKVLRCSGLLAFWLTIKAHVGGRGVVWTGSLEVAELKAEQLRGEGPDPKKVAAGALPLKLTVEEMPS